VNYGTVCAPGVVTAPVMDEPVVFEAADIALEFDMPEFTAQNADACNIIVVYTLNMTDGSDMPEYLAYLNDTN